MSFAHSAPITLSRDLDRHAGGAEQRDDRARSRRGPITSSPRPWCRTWPGPAISTATYTTAGMTRRASVAASRSALSTPFCRLSTTASGERCGASCAAAPRYRWTSRSTARAAAPAAVEARCSRRHDALVERSRLHAQARRRNRVDVRRAPDQRDRVSRPREQPAVIAADRAGAHHRDLDARRAHSQLGRGMLWNASRRAVDQRSRIMRK